MSALSIAGVPRTTATGRTVRGFARGRANTGADRAGRGTVVLRRLAVLIAAVACGVALLLFVQPGAAASENSTAPTATTTVTVEEGQSLWSIAASISGGDDTDRVVEQIKELNGLSGSAVRTGRTLTVPVG